MVENKGKAAEGFELTYYNIIGRKIFIVLETGSWEI
jgi:hypothetical protein